MLLQRVAASRVWQAMADELGARFSAETVAAYADPTHTSLCRCPQCGLDYFIPLVAGDERFYGELTSTATSYYSQDKWDFHAALDFVLPGQRLLDVACGSGDFVAKMAARGIIAEGIDTNSEAVAEARRMGRAVHAISLEEFAQTQSGRFDVVTAFQIIEHIPDVNSLVRAALCCLKPGGLLIITVPNRLRRCRKDFEPLDHPPHHLSHWSAAQLAYLARLHGLSVEAIQYQIADMHESRAVVRRWLASRLPLGADSILARLVARLLCGPILYRLYAATSLLNRWQFWSMSVMAILQRPAR